MSEMSLRANSLFAAASTVLTQAGWALIKDANIASNALISYSKLALTGAILNADLAGGIAYTKLALTGAILNADLAGGIAYTKLTLTGLIVNADIAAAAGIAVTKLALGGAGQVLQSSGVANSFALLVDANIATNALIAVTKLALGSAGQILTGGASNSWSSTPTIGGTTTISGGLNLGSGSGAATGNINASGTFYPSGQASYGFRQYAHNATLASPGDLVVGGDTPIGLMWLYSPTSGQGRLIHTSSGVILNDLGGGAIYTVGSDPGTATINIFLSNPGGGSKLFIRNRTGGPIDLVAMSIGT